MESFSSTNEQVFGVGQQPGVLRARYPSYKSYDRFIDVEKLKSLDNYLTERIRRHISEDKDTFFLNQHRLETDSPYVPGVREIWLTRTRSGTPYDYLDLDQTNLWETTEAADEFALLMRFVETLPFEATGRILIIYDEGGNAVPAHRDHEREDICHEFIWFRTNLNKPLYMLNHLTGENLYVDSYSAWFDTVNQYHGSDATGELSFSFRVDGRFVEELRRLIPKPAANPASAPSVWACTEAEGVL